MSQSRTCGFTLMELMISISILSMVMMVVSMSLHSGVMLNDRVMRQTDINNRANGVLNQLAMQLRMAGPLDLSGSLPAGYTTVDPTKPSYVKSYKFAIATQLGGAPTWKEVYETIPRMIVYDYSVNPGRLILITYNSAGVAEPLLLTPEVDENGFTLARIGNTLQMSLTLRSETRSQESILYTAQAQTLFLRSTLNESSGTSTVTFVDDPDDVGGIISSTTDASPSILFGNLVTQLTTPPQQQLSLFITAPIGQVVDPASIRVILGNFDDTVSQTVPEGATVTVGTATVTRTTYPAVAKWPAQNGTYAITLTGNIPSTVTIKATATTTTGIATDTAHIPTKRYN